jgi:spermidine/putrescine transport system permease protein
MQDLLKRYGMGLTAGFVLLTAFWLLILLILPNLTMFESSFRPYLPVAEIGGPKDVYSLGNYMNIFGGEVPMSIFGFEVLVSARVKIFIMTVFFSVVVTVVAFLLAYPLAYYLAKVVSPRSLPTLFLLLFIPLWVSEVLRSFAWFIILTLKGPLNGILMNIGLIEKEIRWIEGYSPVVVTLVYTYVLFMLFPLYNAMQSLDSNQIEAAEDLGSLVANTLAGDPAACQTRHRLGRGDGVHAVGGLALGARNHRIDIRQLVHPDHPGRHAGRAELERGRSLCLPSADRLHLDGGDRDAGVPRQAF